MSTTLKRRLKRIGVLPSTRDTRDGRVIRHNHAELPPEEKTAEEMRIRQVYATDHATFLANRKQAHTEKKAKLRSCRRAKVVVTPKPAKTKQKKG